MEICNLTTNRKMLGYVYHHIGDVDISSLFDADDLSPDDDDDDEAGEFL